MNLESEDLIAQFQHDFPHQFEVASLRLMTELQDQRIQALETENESLKAQQPQPGGYSPSLARPYIASVPVPDLEDGGRHGG